MKFKIKKERADPVGSSRKGGQIAQDKMTKAIEQLAEQLGDALGEELIQLEVEPKLQKLNKKKLN
jgi:hypothetical protein